MLCLSLPISLISHTSTPSCHLTYTSHPYSVIPRSSPRQPHSPTIVQLKNLTIPNLYLHNLYVFNYRQTVDPEVTRVSYTQVSTVKHLNIFILKRWPNLDNLHFLTMAVILKHVCCNIFLKYNFFSSHNYFYDCACIFVHIRIGFILEGHIATV